MIFLKVKIKKKKNNSTSTLNHPHVAAPQRDSSTHHPPISKVHPPCLSLRYRFSRLQPSLRLVAPYSSFFFL